MNTGKLLIAAAVSSFALASAVACADSPQPAAREQVSAVVRTGDLNLNRPKDIAKLYRRIASAADQLCAPRNLGGMSSRSRDYASCYDDAISRAVGHIDRPLVTAYFEQHNPDSASRNLTAMQ
jgi:UrcA family protein